MLLGSRDCFGFNEPGYRIQRLLMHTIRFPATSAPVKAQPLCGSIFVMNPHVVSAKAPYSDNYEASWSEQSNRRGFRLQLSRAIPIHGGCPNRVFNLSESSGRIGRAQPLSFRTPKIAPSTIAPLVL